MALAIPTSVGTPVAAPAIPTATEVPSAKVMGDAVAPVTMYCALTTAAAPRRPPAKPFTAAVRAWVWILIYLGTANAARMPRMTMTTTNSIIVKPASFFSRFMFRPPLVWCTASESDPPHLLPCSIAPSRVDWFHPITTVRTLSCSTPRVPALDRTRTGDRTDRPDSHQRPAPARRDTGR